MSDVAVMRPQLRRQRISATLSAYIGRQFLKWYFLLLLAIAGIILLISVVDLMNQLSTKEGATFFTVVKLALLKLPQLGQEVMPFIVLFSALGTFWRLTRTHELVVTRSSGVSVWQFLMPVVIASLLVGIATVTILNPLSASLYRRFELLENRILGRGDSAFSVSKGGLWLRQPVLEGNEPAGEFIIHAQRVSDASNTLHDVIAFEFDAEHHFSGRIDAERAELEAGRWTLRDAWSAGLRTRPVFKEQVSIETDLTPDKIRESFARAESISFWNLPAFIEILEQAGFRAVGHRLQWHRLLALPLLFAAMVLLAATSSLRPQRRGRVGLVLLAGGVTGFLLYLLSSFVFALGLSGKIPVALAAWAPSGVSLMLGVAMLLHLEDG